MPTDDERCAEAKTIQRIVDAFRRGDLDALRAAVEDPAVVRTLLEIGADPIAPVDDGFPPLIAALSCRRDVPGPRRRTDVHDVVRLLLSFGADPNQRGINDYTALHAAVAERDALAVQMLLDGGADPELRTRIDECETPREMAEAAGHRGDACAEKAAAAATKSLMRSEVGLGLSAFGFGPATVHRRTPVRLVTGSGVKTTASRRVVP